MKPNEIRAEFILRNIQMKSVAAELNITQATVSQVVAGVRRTRRIQEAIANAIEKPVEKVFPDQKGAA